MSRATDDMHNDIVLPVTTRRGQTMLDLRGQQVSALPESIGQLIALEALDVDENQLTALPKSIGQLMQLKTLSVYGNQLTALPASLGQLGMVSK